MIKNLFNDYEKQIKRSAEIYFYLCHLRSNFMSSKLNEGHELICTFAAFV